MKPEVAEAIPSLQQRGVLSPEAAAVELRVARDELLSVRGELRALLYGGVLTVVAGVGLLVREHLDELGPVAVASAIGIAAAACLVWVVRTAPAFSWQAQGSPNLAFDYVLLLGALLLAADLAYVEVKLSPLGTQWPFHLLAASLIYAALAVRYDSRVVASLALSSFAAWRGVALATFSTNVFESSPVRGDMIRANALGCGVLFVLLGWALLRSNRKPHFEPTATYLGWLLVLGALLGGTLHGYSSDRGWIVWGVITLAVAASVALLAGKARRFPLLAIAVVAGYIALSRFAVEAIHGEKSAFAYFTLSGIALIVGLLLAQRHLREAT